LIKTGNNRIIKFFFRIFKYDNNFILNLLILYKNKKLAYSILKRLLEEENNKIIITDEMYELASKKQNIMALKLLFENEYNSMRNHFIRRINKFNLLEIFVKNNFFSCVEKVLEFNIFNIKNPKCENILIEAINKDENLGKLLIKSLIKPPYSSSEHKIFILNIVIKSGNLNLVKFLIEEFKITSKDINKKDLKGECPIIVAISRNADIFDYLLEKGADLNTKSDDEVPLLFLAIYNDDINSIYSLVNDHTRDTININICDNSGYTPLVLSYITNRIDIFHYLLEYSDINKKDSHGYNIFHYVIQKDDSINAKILCNIGAMIDNSDIDIAVGKKVLSSLLEFNTIPLNYKYNENNEKIPLIFAVINHGNDSKKVYECIEKLIRKGCNVNEKNKNGETPIVLAIRKKYYNIVELLLQHGALKIIQIQKNDIIENKNIIDYVCDCGHYGCCSTTTCIFQKMKFLLNKY